MASTARADSSRDTTPMTMKLGFADHLVRSFLFSLQVRNSVNFPTLVSHAAPKSAKSPISPNFEHMSSLALMQQLRNCWLPLKLKYGLIWWFQYPGLPRGQLTGLWCCMWSRKMDERLFQELCMAWIALSEVCGEFFSVHTAWNTVLVIHQVLICQNHLISGVQMDAPFTC